MDQYDNDPYSESADDVSGNSAGYKLTDTAPCSPVSSHLSDLKAPCSPVSYAGIEPLHSPVRDVETGDVLHARPIDLLWLELTERCNLRCLHCYAESLPERQLTGRMTYTDWQHVLDWVAASNCHAVQFIGGEPTLHPHFTALLHHANQSGYPVIEVFSNATRLSSSVLSAMSTTGARLATSLYGPTESLHDGVTLTPGSFNRTLNGIRKALEFGVPVRVGIIANALSLDNVDATVRLLGDIGVNRISVHKTQAVGRAAINFLDGRQAGGCGRCGKGTLCVTANGAVLPCVFARSQPLGTIWQWQSTGQQTRIPLSSQTDLYKQ